jgi:transcriptional regulator with XRE-family HTH domain
MNFQEYKKNLIAKEKSSRSEYLRDIDNLKFETSKLITEARIHAGITQVELARLAGTLQPSIARLEQGRALPTLSFLKKIADGLNTYLVPPKFGFMEEKEEQLVINKMSNISLSYPVYIPQPENNKSTLWIAKGYGAYESNLTTLR